MEVLGLIFSNIHDSEIFEVTECRTIASCPIGGRYRLIDFPLSNMTNAGIHSIGVVTKNNYQSLMDHIGSGKEWDLARKKGGLTILPPYGVSDKVYSTRLEAIKGITSYITFQKVDYVVLTDCYNVCNIDYKKAIDYHIEKNADITCLYHMHTIKDESAYNKVFTLNDDGRITKMDFSCTEEGVKKASIDTWIMKKSLLLDLIKEAINTNARSFNRDVLNRNLNNYKIYGYEYDGYFGSIHDLKSYYKVNMDLLKKEVRGELFFEPGHAIYTKVRDSAPTKFEEQNCIKNSLIADGCTIEGTIENSIIFRGAKIGKGCVIRNSILMQDTSVSEGTVLDYVITDKNVSIMNKKEIKGSIDDLVYIKKDGIL